MQQPRSISSFSSSPANASKASTVGRPRLRLGTDNDTPEHAFLFCARSIACKFQSDKSIRQKLVERGYSRPVVEEAIRRCYEDRFLDDTRLANIVAENLMSSGRGTGQLVRQKLQKMGVSSDEISKALGKQAGEVDVVGGMTEKLQQKFPNFDPRSSDRKEYLRVTSFFQRRGYSFGQIQSMIDEIHQK